MKFNWLLNGSLASNHLAAGYLVVWIVQGGYACWTAWQWMRIKRESSSATLTGSTTRDR